MAMNHLAIVSRTSLTFSNTVTVRLHSLLCPIIIFFFLKYRVAEGYIAEISE